MGTVISERHLQRIGDMVKRSPGTIVIGGARLTGTSALDGFDLSKGSFFSPTVITDVETTDELWQEEVFGPVVVVKTFKVSAVQQSEVRRPLNNSTDRKRRHFSRK